MKKNQVIIAFVGPIASGKGYAVKYLQKKYQASVYRFSTMLRDITKRVYIEETRENLVKLSWILRKNFGQDVLSKTMRQDILKDSNAIVVIDGARRISDLNYLKKMPRFFLVRIDADVKIRWQRITARRENPDDQKKTLAQFKKDEQSEIEKTSRMLGKLADYSVSNDKDPKDLYIQLDRVIKKIHAHQG